MDEEKRPLRKWTLYKMLGARRPTYYIYTGATGPEAWGIKMELREGAWKMTKDSMPLDMMKRQKEIGRVNVCRLISEAIRLEEMTNKRGGA